MLCDENWIMEVKNKMTSKQDCFELNSKFVTKICMEYKKGHVNHQVRNSLSL